MWGPAGEKGGVSYHLNAANSDPHILEMWTSEESP
jgi:hypothetical protein